MPFKYNKLWKMLIDKGLNKTELRKRTGIGTATLAKLSANEFVSLDVLDKICTELSCDISDVMEYVPDAVNKVWQGDDGHMHAKVPADIYNLDTKALKRKVAETAKGKKA